ncbi:hypothetical protein LCGC14_2161990, partial [marine sediment metagenome]
MLDVKDKQWDFMEEHPMLNDIKNYMLRPFMDIDKKYWKPDYQEFLKNKGQIGGMQGFKPLFMPDYLFDFQKELTSWAIEKGKAAMFADCGLGKTPMQLVWAENVIRKTNRNVLIITPLAVSAQTLREADKFGIDCTRSIN